MKVLACLNLIVLLIFMTQHANGADAGDGSGNNSEEGNGETQTEAEESLLPEEMASGPDFLYELELTEISDSDVFREKLLSVWATNLVVFKMDKTDKLDKVIAKTCSKVKKSFGEEAYQCYGVDCSREELKPICREYIPKLPTMPAIVAFSGEPKKNPYQPRIRNMGRKVVAAYNGDHENEGKILKWAKVFGPDHVTVLKQKVSVAVGLTRGRLLCASENVVRAQPP